MKREMQTRNTQASCKVRVVVRRWNGLAILCEDCGNVIRRGDTYGRLKDGFLNYCFTCCEEIGLDDDPGYPTKYWRQK